MKKKSFPVTHIGSATLVMTLIILCMVIFSALSLSGALHEMNYTRKVADQNTAYHQAVNQAAAQLARMDACFQEAYAAQGDYYTLVHDKLCDETLLSFSDDFSDPESMHCISFRLPITEDLYLSTTIQVLEPTSAGQGYYQMLSQKKISLSDWHGDNSINLLQ